MFCQVALLEKGGISHHVQYPFLDLRDNQKDIIVFLSKKCLTVLAFISSDKVEAFLDFNIN